MRKLYADKYKLERNRINYLYVRMTSDSSFNCAFVFLLSENFVKMNSAPRRKTTRRQLEEMLNFVRANKILLTGKTKPAEAGKIKVLWQQFALTANSFGEGPQKSGEQWRHVFNEWKMNTKRKSRRIFQCVRSTGGGPPAGKELSDLEKQLLEVISKIHLGDHEIVDSLVCGPTNSDDFNLILVNEEPNNSGNPDLSVKYMVESEVSTNSTTVEEPTLTLEPVLSTSKETPCKKKVHPTPKSSRYASTNIREACEKFNEAQKAIASKEAAAIEQSKELIKIEKGKLKLKYYTIFGNCDNFEEFYKNI